MAKGPKPIGYTDRQAAIMKARIDDKAVRASIAVLDLFRLVPDSNQDHAAWLQKQIADQATALKGIVERRRR